jgi:hypothetical protein
MPSSSTNGTSRLREKENGQWGEMKEEGAGPEWETSLVQAHLATSLIV